MEYVGSHRNLYEINATDEEAWSGAREIQGHHAAPTYSLRRPWAVVLVLTAVAGMVTASVAPEDRPLPPASAVSEPTKNIILVDTPPGNSRDDTAVSRPSRSATRNPATPLPAPKIEIVIQFALAQQGDRYRFGAAGPNAYDCSGLVMAAFAQVGVRLPHFTGTMISHGTRVTQRAMQRGDIVFLSDHHVAIYLGGGMMVAASSGKGHIVVQRVYAFYTARRIL